MKPAHLFVLIIALFFNLATAHAKACNSTLDCDFGSGSSCEQGICTGGASGCRSNLDCDFGGGQSCENGVCEGGSPECRSDLDCDFGRGEHCGGDGHCRGSGASNAKPQSAIERILVCSGVSFK